MIRNRIIRYLKDLPTGFSTGELAFYSLSNSFELHLRDKLAYKLNFQLQKDRILREWQNIDISVHRKNGTKIGIELKYGLVSQIIRRRDIKKSGILRSLFCDYQKSIRKIDSWHGVIFLSCPKNKIPEKYRNRVSKFSSVNKYVNYFDTERKSRMFIKQAVDEHFKPNKFKTKVSTLNIGTCFGVNIDMIWVLISKE